MTWPTPPDNTGNFDSLLGGRVTPSASFKGQFPVRWSGYVEDAAKKPAFEYDPSKPGNRGAQKFWADGNPVENLWITLRTDVRDPNIQGDNGHRILVLDSKNKVEAVQEAVRESGASFERNGYLDIEWYGNDPNGKNPDNPPKLYRARYRGATLDSALGVQQAPPTPAAPAAAWGQQPSAPVSAPPATGGWGNATPAQVPPNAAPAAPGWGAQSAAQATTPAATPGAATAGQWGTAAPAPAPVVSSGVHPGLVEALRKKGVNLPGDATQATAEGIWAVVQHNPDVA